MMDEFIFWYVDLGMLVTVLLFMTYNQRPWHPVFMWICGLLWWIPFFCFVIYGSLKAARKHYYEQLKESRQ